MAQKGLVRPSSLPSIFSPRLDHQYILRSESHGQKAAGDENDKQKMRCEADYDCKVVTGDSLIPKSPDPRSGGVPTNDRISNSFYSASPP
jgi:hypothetical protein